VFVLTHCQENGILLIDLLRKKEGVMDYITMTVQGIGTR
jgi:hypothetical protein